MAHAYRYFDVNFNNRVSFNEFQKGLDHLRIKYQVNEVNMIFQYLDQKHKGYISY
jgi:Ca2+-binding EF-hand superfamily protein